MSLYNNYNNCQYIYTYIGAHLKKYVRIDGKMEIYLYKHIII